MFNQVQKQIHVGETNQIRFPATALLGISSHDRYNANNVPASLTSSPYNFQLYAPQNYLNGQFHRIAVSEVSFSWTIPTITERNNKLTVFFQPGGTGTISTYYPKIANGWYDCTTLAAALQASIRALTEENGDPVAGVSTVTVVFSTTQYNFTVATGSTDKIAIYPYTNPNFPNTTGSLFDMMGWGSFNVGIAPLTLQVTSNTPCLLSTSFVDFTCPQLTYSQDVKDGDTSANTHDLVCRLYLNDSSIPYYNQGSRPFLQYADFTSPKQIKWSPNLPIGSMNFQLYDEDGNPLGVNFGNQSASVDWYMGDWSMTLLASEN